MKWLVGLLFAFFLFVAAVIVAADRGRLPGFLTALYAFPGGDKVGHFVLMGGLSFLVNLSLIVGSAPRFAHPRRIGTLALLLLVTAEEISQLFFRTRTFSWIDLGSSYAGILLFAYLASALGRRRRRPRRTDYKGAEA